VTLTDKSDRHCSVQEVSSVINNCVYPDDGPVGLETCGNWCFVTLLQLGVVGSFAVADLSCTK
jgi:hypothetical protein